MAVGLLIAMVCDWAHFPLTSTSFPAVTPDPFLVDLGLAEPAFLLLFVVVSRTFHLFDHVGEFT